MPARDVRLATRPTCSSSSPTSRNPLVAWQPPTQLFSCAHNCSFCSFHLHRRRAHLTKTVTISQCSARLAGSFSHLLSVECTGSSFECNSRISMPSIYICTIPEHKHNKLGPTAAIHSSDLRSFANGNARMTSRRLEFWRLDVCLWPVKQIHVGSKFSRKKAIDGTSEGLSPMATGSTPSSPLLVWRWRYHSISQRVCLAFQTAN